MTPIFTDRREAGRVLAKRLEGYAGQRDVLVLALPRGGVPVAFEVAQALRAPLDVFLVRKLGVPGQEEFAMGAIAAGGVRLVNWEIVEALGIAKAALDAVIAKEERELARRARLYRGSEGRLTPGGRLVILVDDGLATGATMRVAVQALRRQNPSRIAVAVPIAAPSVCAELGDVADDVVCAMTPEPFHSVGLWYEDFSQTTDEEVQELLELAAPDPKDHRQPATRAP